VLTISAPVGSGDRLFGSVTNQDIASAIYAARKIRVDKRNVDLAEPIKTVGTFMVKVDVHDSVEPAEVKVIVVPEERKG
jgi:large subunit ribosomal protein L9